MTIQRGQVYFVKLNPVQGREQAGKRPVLVLSIDAINQSPLVVTVVVGTKGENVRRDFLTKLIAPSDFMFPNQEFGCPGGCRGIFLFVGEPSPRGCPCQKFVVL
jgi:hypothetical protein